MKFWAFLLMIARTIFIFVDVTILMISQFVMIVGQMIGFLFNGFTATGGFGIDPRELQEDLDEMDHITRPGTECQKFSTKKEARLYAKIRRHTQDDLSAGFEFGRASY